jgi:dTMP kinase
MKGKFIVIEGVDFTGKTTQSRRISNLLTSLGIENVITREPGGTRLGEILRNLVLSSNEEEDFCKEAVVLLFTAARAENISKVIKPALESGKTVICDRFLASTLAYQNALFGFERDDILAIHSKFNYNLFPDITILLDASPQVLLERRKSNLEKPISEGSIKSRTNNKYD